MHRRSLLDLMEVYASSHPEEGDSVGRIRQLVESREDCFQRSCLPGHITASSWILSPDRSHFLLTHHRKLGRWLQLGGHADGECDVRLVALCEAREESGMADFSIPQRDAQGLAIPIDVDVHSIPGRPGEPEHEHHDIRFLLLAGANQDLCISDESNDLRWFTYDQLDSLEADESLLRLARKARPHCQSLRVEA